MYPGIHFDNNKFALHSGIICAYQSPQPLDTFVKALFTVLPDLQSVSDAPCGKLQGKAAVACCVTC